MNRFLTSFAVAALLLSSCTTLKELAASNTQKPSLSFKDARLRDVSLSDATVDVVLEVQNPNEAGLSLAETDYRLLVEGHQLVTGKPPAGLKIPGHGVAEVTLPATVKFADLGQSVLALLSKKQVGYKAEGHLGVDSPLGLVSLPFSHDGVFDLPQVPDVAVGSPSLKGVSLTSATLELPVTIKNLNQFALPLAGLAGSLQIAGADVGAVNIHDVGSLPAKGAKKVAVPVQIRFADALSAYQALRSGSARVDLRGELKSGSSSVPFALSREVNLSQGGESGSDATAPADAPGSAPADVPAPASTDAPDAGQP